MKLLLTKRLLFVSGALLFLCACEKAPLKEASARRILRSMPVLLGAHQLSQNERETSYWTHASLPIIITFYENEMERTGWQLLAQHHAPHISTLIFQKPQTVTLVQISQRTRHTHYVRVNTMQRSVGTPEN